MDNSAHRDSFKSLSDHQTHDETTRQFFSHTSARRINTDAVIAKALRQQYPNLALSIAPAGRCNLLAYAASGHAQFTPVGEDDDDHHVPSSLSWKIYVPPARRMDGDLGGIAKETLFEKYLYQWKDKDFIVYLISGRDGASSYPQLNNFYVLATHEELANQLILAAGQWTSELHEEIWVFDGGYWDKNSELYQSAMKSSWENVILDEDMKNALIEDHLSFFKSRATYARLKVPWKRGIIYYGPPGNGKTISIKATMNMLYHLKQPVTTLYVRSLKSFMGPEASIAAVFAKAREFAPCYLVFEDLDTIVTDDVRSYFLNEVDGLKSNDGIFMIGSTNHLDRLDPGISKRPSRFDRKYLFPDPDFNQRVDYCKFWQKKLADNKAVSFPNKLCPAIAEITNDFSFAYMQEAFVAALLAIARREQPDEGDEDDAQDDAMVMTVDLAEDDWVKVLDKPVEESPELDELELWVEIKKQVAILREGMEKTA
ncbi:atpase [Trichoderma arundinaceum]|uniref:Atpase n=1 Tax=Trichoderma arundinaceum TaxID=490622 RepID=A0A395P0U3_TRIAR|nr:atpase [Trichoderma arundinaceum]